MIGCIVSRTIAALGGLVLASPTRAFGLATTSRTWWSRHLDFVVLGDTGQIVGGRYPKAERYARDMWTGFWHGEEKGLLAFLDGSARLETMGTPVTATYSLFMDQSKHSSASYKSPYVP